MEMKNATGRFSDRVDNYVRYRPGYPAALVPELLKHCALDTDATVADFGSGTGIFTQLLLASGLEVYGVEPNDNMRHAAEKLLARQPGFTSVDGSAEHSGLNDNAVDLITAAQAFHWFNNDTASAEFRRVLRPGGQLALIWNQRKISQSLQQEYDALLRQWAPEYGAVNHMNLGDDEIAGYFEQGRMQLLTFDNSQQLEFSGLLGRLKSASYCPPENTASYDSLVAALGELFERHARDGRISFDYDTRLYLGPVAR